MGIQTVRVRGQRLKELELDACCLQDRLGEAKVGTGVGLLGEEVHRRKDANAAAGKQGEGHLNGNESVV